MSATGSNEPAGNPQAAPVTLAPGQPAAQSIAAPPAPGPTLLSTSTLPWRVFDHASKGYHLEVVISPGRVLEAAAEMDRAGLAIDTITGVDWLGEKQMEVVYDYFHAATGLRVVIRSRIGREEPQIASICDIFPGANWHERETHDFFGIHFIGHPNLEPFLLPEDATYHPLRKDFTS